MDLVELDTARAAACDSSSVSSQKIERWWRYVFLGHAAI
jgi:hypothetical protein